MTARCGSVNGAPTSTASCRRIALSMTLDLCGPNLTETQASVTPALSGARRTARNRRQLGLLGTLRLLHEVARTWKLENMREATRVQKQFLCLCALLPSSA